MIRHIFGTLRDMAKLFRKRRVLATLNHCTWEFKMQGGPNSLTVPKDNLHSDTYIDKEYFIVRCASDFSVFRIFMTILPAFWRDSKLGRKLGRLVFTKNGAEKEIMDKNIYTVSCLLEEIESETNPLIEHYAYDDKYIRTTPFGNHFASCGGFCHELMERYHHPAIYILLPILAYLAGTLTEAVYDWIIN